MRLWVIAEGVETADQASRLAASGCDYLQGCHFGRPMPVERVASFVEGLAALGTPRAAAL